LSSQRPSRRASCASDRLRAKRLARRRVPAPRSMKASATPGWGCLRASLGVAGAAAAAFADAGRGPAAQAMEPLVKLSKTIALPGVSGRIDHLDVDLPGQRLFVAALGNNTVEVI